MPSDSDLLAWNRMGLIPGPKESEEQFLRRVELSLARRPDEPPTAVVAKAVEDAAKLYDVAPTWVPILYCNSGLGIWHGGGTLLERVEDLHLPAIQLRKTLSHKPRYLGIYSGEEFLLHEMVHVGRAAFEEHQFEEIIAYKASRSRFRRFFGPIVHSGKEAWIFVIALAIPIAVDYFMFALGSLEIGLFGLLIYLLPILLLTYALSRLTIGHLLYTRAFTKIKALTKDEAKARYVAYRLSDREIRQFARRKPDEIRAYIEQQESLRWRAIRLSYF